MVKNEDYELILKGEVKTLHFKDDYLYLGGSKLPMVSRYTLSYDVSEEAKAYPTLEVRGALPEKNGDVMIRFGEIVYYELECLVKIV